MTAYTEDEARGRWKFTLTFEEREDGGLRVLSDDLPGLVLSNADRTLVLRDFPMVFEVLLDEWLKAHP